MLQIRKGLPTQPQKPNCDIEARRPTGIGPIAAPFPFYIDDLSSAVEAPQVILIDDDVAMWTQDTELERAISKLHNELDVVTSLSTSWKMEPSN